MERYVKVNMVPNTDVPPRVRISQYEKGWPIYADMYKDGEPWYPPVAVGMVRGTKKDMTGFEYNISVVNNRATIMLTDQMTIFDGDQRIEIVFTDGDTKIATADIILEIKSSPLKSDTVISRTDMPVIQDLDQVVAAMAANILTDSTEQALKSEAYAKGTRNGVDVPSTDPAYNNNSKYYSQQAAGSANAASGSATAAVNAETNASGYAQSASGSATSAAQSAASAAAAIATTHDWAIGPNGTPGEPSDQNNAKYYADQAALMWARIQSLGITFYLDEDTGILYYGMS